MTSWQPCWWTGTIRYFSSGSSLPFLCKLCEQIFFCFALQHGGNANHLLRVKSYSVCRILISKGSLDKKCKAQGLMSDTQFVTCFIQSEFKMFEATVNKCTASKGFLVEKKLSKHGQDHFLVFLSCLLIHNDNLALSRSAQVKGGGIKDSIVKRRTKTRLALLSCLFIALLQSPKNFGDITCL